jgi:lipopolysaccharide/colanic/teichoic acid biosynthesis glycosyltransferase
MLFQKLPAGRLQLGVSGWAQILGLRDETDTDEEMRQRVEHDLYYIVNWSLALSLQIMIRTPCPDAHDRDTSTFHAGC